MAHRTLALATTLVLFAFLPASVQAEEHEAAEDADYGRAGVYLEVGGQAMLPVFRGQSNGDPSGGVTARAGWRVGSRVAVELHYEWDYRLRNNSSNVITADAKVFILTGRIQPYARAGLGVIFGRVEGTGGTQSSFAARFGTGLDYWLTENWAATVYGDFVLPTDHFHRLNYFTAGLGGRYRF